MLPSHLAIVDDFRPPACTWCAGNRGIEFAVEPGTDVVSSADGWVTFAGRVAGTTYVVVRTVRGVLVTHGGLSGTSVRQGNRLVAGDTLGTAGDVLYIGVRIGGRYVDPKSCTFTRGRPRAVLVGR